jgi:hypothetical protein
MSWQDATRGSLGCSLHLGPVGTAIMRPTTDSLLGRRRLEFESPSLVTKSPMRSNKFLLLFCSSALLILQSPPVLACLQDVCPATEGIFNDVDGADPGGCGYSTASFKINVIASNSANCPTQSSTSLCSWTVEVVADLDPNCSVGYCLRGGGDCSIFPSLGSTNLSCDNWFSGPAGDNDLLVSLTLFGCCKIGVAGQSKSTTKLVASLRTYDPLDPDAIGDMFARRGRRFYCTYCN